MSLFNFFNWSTLKSTNIQQSNEKRENITTNVTNTELIDQIFIFIIKQSVVIPEQIFCFGKSIRDRYKN